MVFEKIRQDLFRHWILGLGSGDLRINTMGAFLVAKQVERGPHGGER